MNLKKRPNGENKRSCGETRGERVEACPGGGRDETDVTGVEGLSLIQTVQMFKLQITVAC